MKRFALAVFATTLILDAHAETFDVSVTSNRFTPNNLTISVGDTVRWTNNGGFHDVVEDNAAFSSGSPAGPGWVFERTFQSEAEILYHCTVHSAPGRPINTSMNGRINVVASNGFVINQGISGAWLNADTEGQGFLFDVDPDSNFLFAAWFTYQSDATAVRVGSDGQRWLTIQGTYDGPGGSLPISSTSGGSFNAATTTNTVQVGTATIEFTDCSNGTISYDLTDEALTGSIAITRLLPTTSALCEQLSSASASSSVVVQN